MEEGKRGPIKVTVKDKRKTAAADAATGSDQSPAATVAEETPGVSAREERGQVLLDETSEVEQMSIDESTGVGAGAPTDEAPDYLGDLQRLQAEFANYRKRMMKEQVEAGTRAKAGLMERLLPIIDNFERAIEHGEVGDGVQLVFKELVSTLEAEGLEEIPAEGAPFDPRVHEAVESREDEGVEVPTVRAVHRRGFKVGDRVLRAAMVGVANPVEASDTTEA